MDTKETQMPSSQKFKIIVTSIPCLLVLYNLGIGPIAKLDDGGYISEPENKVLRVIYAPLGIFCKIPGSTGFFDWYIFDVWKCDPMTTR